MKDSTIALIITLGGAIITLSKILIEGLTKETKFMFGATVFFLGLSLTMLYLENKIEKNKIIVPEVIYKEKKKR